MNEGDQLRIHTKHGVFDITVTSWATLQRKAGSQPTSVPESFGTPVIDVYGNRLVLHNESTIETYDGRLKITKIESR